MKDERTNYEKSDVIADAVCRGRVAPAPATSHPVSQRDIPPNSSQRRGSSTAGDLRQHCGGDTPPARACGDPRQHCEGVTPPARACWDIQSAIRNPKSEIAAFLRRLNRDERGTVSIMTVFALFMFTILLVKIINVGRHVDDKIRMQNAADGAAWSGGVVMARGMNTLAFTNHLEAEVFALTAYMRTAQMRNDNGELLLKTLTPQLLDKWQEVGGVFEQGGRSAGYAKFEKLGRAIQQKVPLERQVVATFSDMTAKHSEMTLPVLEYILHAGEHNTGNRPQGQTLGQPVNVPEGGIIPRFQRELVRGIPMMANLAGDEIARRYGEPGERLRQNRVPLQSRMWRTDAVCFAGADENDPLTRALPAIDPSPTGTDGPPSASYTDIARRQRERLAKHYLELWIRDWMGPYFSYAAGVPLVTAQFGRDRTDGRNRLGRDTAKMSQFINLWRAFSCGHLAVLLDGEYRFINLPHVIRSAVSTGSSGRDTIERDHQYVAAAYWSHIEEMFPGLFKNRLNRDPGSDAVTFAQVTVFIPRNRHLCCPWADRILISRPDGGVDVRWINHREQQPTDWSLFNQNWQCKLVPATTARLPEILSQAPPDLQTFRPPRLNGVSIDDLRRISKH